MRVEDREVENVGEILQVRDAEERVNEMKGRRVIHERLKRESQRAEKLRVRFLKKMTH